MEYGASEGNRTLTTSLGSLCSATKLHLRITLLYMSLRQKSSVWVVFYIAKWLFVAVLGEKSFGVASVFWHNGEF